MDGLHKARNNLFEVLEQLRLTGPERRQLETDLKLLYNTALDVEEEKIDDERTN